MGPRRTPRPGLRPPHRLGARQEAQDVPWPRHIPAQAARSRMHRSDARPYWASKLRDPRRYIHRRCPIARLRRRFPFPPRRCTCPGTLAHTDVPWDSLRRPYLHPMTRLPAPRVHRSRPRPSHPAPRPLVDRSALDGCRPRGSAARLCPHLPVPPRQHVDLADSASRDARRTPWSDVHGEPEVVDPVSHGSLQATHQHDQRARWQKLPVKPWGPRAPKPALAAPVVVV